MAELSPDLKLSHYRIVSKIGADVMGEVYLAQDTSELGRTVALKILPAEIAKDRDRLRRFTHEARTVSHPVTRCAQRKFGNQPQKEKTHEHVSENCE